MQEHENGVIFVHYIHSMVNDYLLSDKRLQVLNLELGDGPIEASHGRLWACCVEHVQALIKPLMTEQEIRELGLNHPFLSYAAEYILYHAEMAWESTKYQKQIRIWLKKQSSWLTRMKQYRNIEENHGLLDVVILDGLPNLTRVLLAQSVDVMSPTEKGDTLQALAFSGGNIDMLKILLDHGVEIDEQGGECGAVFRAALRGGDAKVVKFLLKYGAYKERYLRRRGGVFETALRMGNLEIIDILHEFNTRSVNIFDRECAKLLQVTAAVDGDNEEAVSLLVNRDADVNADGGFLKTVLHAAVCEGNKEIIQLLINEGVDINASCGYNGNALRVAAIAGDNEITKLLIDKGADINAAGGYHGGPLQVAAARGHLKVMDLLLSHGADIEAESGEIGNALCAASIEADPEIVEFLLERGANPNVNVGYFGNPLQAAAAGRSDEINVVKLLIARGSNINAQGGEYGNALCAALARHNAQIMIYLLQNGAKTDLRDSFNRTALHYAVKESPVEMVQELLNWGASLEEVDDAQASPLDIAIQNRNSAMVHLLLPHVRDMPALSANDWRDCLEWASYYCIEFCISQPRCIIKHDGKLPQSLVDELFPVIPSNDISPSRWKTVTLITSISKAKV